MVQDKRVPRDLKSYEMRKGKFSNLRLKSSDKNHDIKGIALVPTYHTLLKSLSAFLIRILVFSV